MHSDNTNDQKYELYALIVEVDGTGFPLAYLFLETNGESGANNKTNVITIFLKSLRDKILLNPVFFLTDKDFAQISAAQSTWPGIKIQLCKWHIQIAIETKLKDYRVMSRTNYDGHQANRKFSFIDKQFIPTVSANKKTKIRFYPEEYRPFVWNLMNQHLHLHPLIPNSSGQFLNSDQIHEQAVQEMYSYCEENSLVWVWSYMWNEWYRDGRWELWARSVFSEISILKTTMFIEGHWRMIRRDFLYKYFRPRLDLVTYTLLKKIIPLQEQKFQQILCKRESPDWKKQFKAE